MTDIGPGTKLECIRDDFPVRYPPELYKGGIYTVFKVHKNFDFQAKMGKQYKKADAVELIELPNWIISLNYFRPLGGDEESIGTEEGMKILRECLENLPETVD